MAKRVSVIPRGQIAAFVADPAIETVAVPVELVDKKVGPVTFWQKVKGYYKGLIAVIGSTLIILNELTPVLNFLPGQDKQYVTLVIAILTGIGTFLKENEHWIPDTATVT